MPLNPNILERLLLLRLNKGPAPILDLFGAASFEAVTLAIELDLFETLNDEETTVAECADTLDLHEDALRMLLRFLEAQGYVAETPGGYKNTRMTAKWLTVASVTNIAPWFTFWNDLVFPFWEQHLEPTLRRGAPPLTIYGWFDEDPDCWPVAQRGFRAVASVIVDEVTDKIKFLQGAARVIDIGGGHGLYAITLCREYPRLSATIFDTPKALGAARTDIAAAGVGDRIEVTGGDYQRDSLGEGYDMSLVFNIIHAHDEAGNRQLFDRIREALNPGGHIVILDQLAGSVRTPVGKTGIGFVGLTYLTTLGAKVHTFADVAEWLRATGFENVQRSSIRRGGPGNTLIQAANPADESASSPR